MAPSCSKKRLSGKTKQGTPRKRCPTGTVRDRRSSCGGLKTVRCRRSSSPGGAKKKPAAPRRRESSSLRRVINCKSKLSRWTADYDILRCEDVIACKDGDKKKKSLLAVFDRNVPFNEYKVEGI